MVFTCVVQGCRKSPEPYVRSLHGFPDNSDTMKAWNEFVKKTKPKWNGNTPSSRICSEHFQPACYKNHMAWSMRWVRTLELIDDFMVPTIYPAVMKKSATHAKNERKAGRTRSPSAAASSSAMPAAPGAIKEESLCSPVTSTDPVQECHVKAECQVMYVVRHVASQTDPPPRSQNTRSVSTQLTGKSRQCKFRSTATQVKLMSQDCGVCTLTGPMLFLQPTLVKRASKRLRLSLEYEDPPSECTINTSVQDKISST